MEDGSIVVVCVWLDGKGMVAMVMMVMKGNECLSRARRRHRLSGR